MSTYTPQKAEDAPALDADLAVPVLGVRNDANTTRTSTDGDYGNFAIDGSGHPQVVGSIAHGSPDANAPIKIGGKARNVEPTAVAEGNRVDALLDLVGKLVTLPYTIPENMINGTGSATGTGDTAVIAAQGAGVRIYVTTLIISNSSATATTVSIKDGSTEKLVIPAPGTSGAIITLPTPLRLTANTALNFASAAGVTTMKVSAVGYKGI